MNNVTYSVPELHCGACEQAVQKGLGRLAGISSVAVDLTAKTVAIQFDPAEVTESELKGAIENAGFDVA